jgi:hypothetical protein
LFKLLFFAFLENYPDFFGNLSSVIQAMRLMSREESELKNQLDGENEKQD